MSTDENTPQTTRRLFTAKATAAAAGWILTACGPKRLYEVPKATLRQRIQEMEQFAKSAAETSARF